MPKVRQAAVRALPDSYVLQEKETEMSHTCTVKPSSMFLTKSGNVSKNRLTLALLETCGPLIRCSKCGRPVKYSGRVSPRAKLYAGRTHDCFCSSWRYRLGGEWQIWAKKLNRWRAARRHEYSERIRLEIKSSGVEKC